MVWYSRHKRTNHSQNLPPHLCSVFLIFLASFDFSIIKLLTSTFLPPSSFFTLAFCVFPSSFMIWVWLIREYLSGTDWSLFLLVPDIESCTVLHINRFRGFFLHLPHLSFIAFCWLIFLSLKIAISYPKYTFSRINPLGLNCPHSSTNLQAGWLTFYRNLWSSFAFFNFNLLLQLPIYVLLWTNCHLSFILILTCSLNCPWFDLPLYFLLS